MSSSSFGQPPRAPVPDLDLRLRNAVALHRSGRLDEARQAYLAILAVAPGHFDCLHMLGVVAGQQRQFQQSVELLRQAIAVEPGVGAVHANLGLALLELKQHDAAVASFDQALALQPDHAEAWNSRGHALTALGRFEAAIASYDRAIELRPGHANTHYNRGNALKALGRLEAAIASYDRALALQPAHIDALYNRGNALQELGQLEAAIESYDRALAQRPDLAVVWNNRGYALQLRDEISAAIASYDRAAAVAPGYAEPWNNRGNALQAANDLAAAAASFERALDLDPGYQEARANLGFLRLLSGDFERGWPLCEARWATRETGRLRRDFAQPLWRGEEALAGRTILLHAEQGYGDTLQFCRYAPRVAARGARVLLEVQPGLVELLRDLPGVASVFTRGEALPAFDLHSPLLSLPLAFGTRLDDVPAAVPYLHAHAERVARWRERLGPARGRRIGVVWSGGTTHRNDRHRSIALARFASLFAAPAEFVSLQREVRPVDAPVLATCTAVRHWGEALTDFAETAALVSLLDLVVTVDTAVAHLAAALGRPTWILLPYSPDWRWMLDRDDSPWYPTVRLFRQKQRDDWDGVLAAVRDSLPDAVGPAGAGSPL